MKKRRFNDYYQDGVIVSHKTTDETGFKFKGKAIGIVSNIKNWGTDFLARPLNEHNKFFKNLREASDYLVEQSKSKTL